MKRSTLIVCLPLLLAAGSAAAQRQQEPAPPDDGLFIDSVDVNVVNVDVYVTDKKGTRITGLTKDDFEIFEDKRPVAITNFYAVEAGKPTTPLEEEAAPRRSPDARRRRRGWRGSRCPRTSGCGSSSTSTTSTSIPSTAIG